MRVGLLECDHVSPQYAGIAGDYRDMFTRLFARHAPEVELVPFDVSAGVLPDRVDACEGYVCTGSRHSAFDDLEWIHQLSGFVQELHASAVPFVGICFGHQVLAHALGGTVTPWPGGWGAGGHVIDLEAAAGCRPWMDPALRQARLLFMHQDQVTSLPPGATVLGRSDHCPIAMFEVGATMLGIQAHPEFAVGYAEALIRDRTLRIGKERAAAALAGLTLPTDEAAVTAWMARYLAGTAPSAAVIPGTTRSAR